jgi:HD-GYP domain-containing protein (c-di-GMP phosphodiesterase class II)
MLLAERLVGEARERRKRRMARGERSVDVISALLFLALATAIAVTMPSDRALQPVVLAALVVGYAVFSRVRFEFGEAYVSAEELAFVPMLLLLPLPYVPLLVAGAAVLAILPELRSGEWHRERWVSCISHSWFALGPVLVVGTLAPGEASLGDFQIYALAFGAQLVGDFAWAVVRDRLLDPLPLRELTRNYLATARVSAILSSVAWVIGIVAVQDSPALLVIVPLVWLLAVFSRERQQRYSATLELNRAYRGTVMLLADVVEYEDGYTAQHSRSVVDLVQAVADELGIHPNARQELEFAALLHDVGKISIPKEILNKPGKLTAEEFELMKTHTIEGQFMLDRVGGLLGRVGEIVRSCHERWDGQGYPDGLAGDDIPLAARIVFVCDAYNAMTTDRPYRQAMSLTRAVAELTANAGTQFDPRMVTALTRVVEEGTPELDPADQVRALLGRIPTPPRLEATG